MKFSPKNSIIRSPAAELDNTFNLAVHPDVFASQIEGILIGFMNSVNDSIYPDFELTHGVYPPNDPNLKLLLTDTISNYKNKLLEVNENYLVAFVNIVLLQPKSRGFIRLNGTSPCNKPIIRPRYFSDEEDMDKMLRAVKFQLSYFETNAYRENDGEFIWIPIEECDRFPFRSDDYLRCYIKYSTGTDYHPTSTCKMGPDSDSMAVVDPLLRVRNVAGLRVVDAAM